MRPALRASAELIVLAVLGGLGGCAPAPGPMQVPFPHGYGGIIIDVGASFTDALDVITLPTDESAQILAVRELTPSGLTLNEVYLAGDEREENFQYEPRFPPTEHKAGPLVPAEGATLEPETQQGPMKGYALVFHYTVPEEGKFLRGGYVIDYLYAGKRYSVEVTAEITVCTPEFVEDDGSCPMLGGAPG